jgi:hypothetical protein
MKNLYCSLAAALSLGLLASPAAHAQLGVGYPGTTAPRTMLDVNGAIAVAETALDVTTNAGTVPTTAGQVRLTGTPTAPVVLNSATTPALVAGQRVVIYNASTFSASFNGQNIPVGQAVEFFYSTTASGFLASAGGGTGNFWGLMGNAGTTPNTQFIGTTDAQDFVTKTNGAEHQRIASNGDVSFRDGSVAVDAQYTNGSTLYHGLRFGYVSSGEGIASNRTDNTAGLNEYGLDFYTATINRLAITNGGNVGIGTAGPGSKLQVGGAFGVPYLNSNGGPDPLVLDNSHHTIRRIGTATIDLPLANTCYGRIYTIINGLDPKVTTQTAFTLTVNRTTGTVFDDVTNTNFAAGPNGFPPNTRITIQSDGGDWIVIGR